VRRPITCIILYNGIIFISVFMPTIIFLHCLPLLAIACYSLQCISDLNNINTDINISWCLLISTCIDCWTFDCSNFHHTSGVYLIQKPSRLLLLHNYACKDAHPVKDHLLQLYTASSFDDRHVDYCRLVAILVYPISKVRKYEPSSAFPGVARTRDLTRE